MLRTIKKNRIMTSIMILSIAAFSAFMTACEAETIVKEVEVIKEGGSHKRSGNHKGSGSYKGSREGSSRSGDTHASHNR
ncbi:MAG: hypothetical protein CM1200mP3_08810 [Chloroflexota bacterium]|nr:MAG: hypothetical protein CM1200mP3_08810 [Chloroflexota bacterium]